MQNDRYNKLLSEYAVAKATYEAARDRCRVLKEELRKAQREIEETTRVAKLTLDATRQKAREERERLAEEKKKARELRIRLANERKEAKEKARRERLIKRAIEHGFTEYL